MRNFAILAAMMAATVIGATDEARAQDDAGVPDAAASEVQDDGAEDGGEEQDAPAAPTDDCDPNRETCAVQAALLLCETVEGQLIERLHRCLAGETVSAPPSPSTCQALCVQPVRDENGVQRRNADGTLMFTGSFDVGTGMCTCNDDAGYRHPRANRRRSTSVAACSCVHVTPQPPRSGGGGGGGSGGGGGRPERRSQEVCPPDAVDGTGQSLAGRTLAPRPGHPNDVDYRGDRDCDGRLDDADNCAYQWNRDQLDSDLDGIGDRCDVRDDNSHYRAIADQEITEACTEADPDRDERAVCVALVEIRALIGTVAAEQIEIRLRPILARLDALEGRVDRLEAVILGWLGRATIGVGTYTSGDFGGAPVAELTGQMGYMFHRRVGVVGHLIGGIDVFGEGRHSAVIGGGGGFEFIPWMNNDVVTTVGVGVAGVHAVIMTDGDPGALDYWYGYLSGGVTIGPGHGFHIGGRVLYGRHETDRTQPQGAFAFQVFGGWEFL